jgi:hypothetical protein
MIYPTCYAHSDYPRQGCPDCTALRNSTYLAMVRNVRRGTPTPEEQGRLDEVAERFAGPEGVVRAAGYEVRGTVE